MNVLVTASVRMVLTPDGNLWTPLSSFSYIFWERYLDVYDEVFLMVRTLAEPIPPEGYFQATGPRIKAMPLPAYRSVKELAQNYFAFRRRLREVLGRVQAVQVRLPCPVGQSVVGLLEKGRPYGVEIIGDPYDAYAPGNKHKLRPFLRAFGTYQLKQICAKATGTAYVTEKILQRRYPPSSKAFTTNYSSIRLTNEALVTKSRNITEIPIPVKIVSIGSMDELYKGFHILMDAMVVCIQRGREIELTLVGDGLFRTQLEIQAKNANIEKAVHFAGYLKSANAIHKALDSADIFVLPSLAEGLPKVIIEAMARALPCIGSTVGGQVELLPEEYLVPPGDVEALAEKLWEVSHDLNRLNKMSAQNLKKAQEYRQEILSERRRAFYQYISQKTQDWEQKRVLEPK